MTTLYLLAHDKDRYAKILEKTLNTIEIIGSADDFLNNHFSEFSAGKIYKSWNITGKDRYEVSFGMTIDREQMDLKTLEVLDENFCQPHFTDAEYNGKIKEILKKLSDQKLINYKDYLW